MVFGENTGAGQASEVGAAANRSFGAMRQRNLEAGIGKELGIATWNII